jgi:hypothetical protein
LDTIHQYSIAVDNSGHTPAAVEDLLSRQDNFMWRSVLGNMPRATLGANEVMEWRHVIPYVEGVARPRTRVVKLADCVRQGIPRDFGKWDFGMGEPAMQSMTALLLFEVEERVPRWEQLPRTDQIAAIKEVLARIPGWLGKSISTFWDQPENDEIKANRNMLRSFLLWLVQDPTCRNMISIYDPAKDTSTTTGGKPSATSGRGGGGAMMALGERETQSKSGDKCHGCGATGHWKSECPTNAKPRRPQNGKFPTRSRGKFGAVEEDQDDDQDTTGEQEQGDAHEDQHPEEAEEEQEDSEAEGGGMWAAEDSMDVEVSVGGKTLVGRVDSGYRSDHVDVLANTAKYEEWQKLALRTGGRVKQLPAISLKGGGGTFKVDVALIPNIKIAGPMRAIQGTFRVGKTDDLPTDAVYVSWGLGRWLV